MEDHIREQVAFGKGISAHHVRLIRSAQQIIHVHVFLDIEEVGPEGNIGVASRVGEENVRSRMVHTEGVNCLALLLVNLSGTDEHALLVLRDKKGEPLPEFLRLHDSWNSDSVAFLRLSGTFHLLQAALELFLNGTVNLRGSVPQEILYLVFQVAPEFLVGGDDTAEFLTHLVIKDGHIAEHLVHHVKQNSHLDRNAFQIRICARGYVCERVSFLRIIDGRELLMDKFLQELLVPEGGRSDGPSGAAFYILKNLAGHAMIATCHVEVNIELLGHRRAELLPLAVVLPSDIRQADSPVGEVPDDHIVVQEGLNAALKQGVLRGITVFTIVRSVTDVQPENSSQLLEGEGTVDV